MANQMYQDKDPEPIEVHMLKQKLACFACKCINCKKYIGSNSNSNSRTNKLKNSESTGVQVDKSDSDRFSKDTTTDRFSKETSTDRIDDKSKRIDKGTDSSLITTFCTDFICPVLCHYIAEFFRGHFNKVYKDGESETNPVVRYDMSTEKSINNLDKTTSTMKCDLSCVIKKQRSADLAKAESKDRKSEKIVFNDSISDEENKKDTAGKHIGNIAKLQKNIVDNDKPVQTSPDVENQVYLDRKHSPTPPKQNMCGTCICVEKFINAIRTYA